MRRKIDHIAALVVAVLSSANLIWQGWERNDRVISSLVALLHFFYILISLRQYTVITTHHYFSIDVFHFTKVCQTLVYPVPSLPAKFHVPMLQFLFRFYCLLLLLTTNYSYDYLLTPG